MSILTARYQQQYVIIPWRAMANIEEKLVPGDAHKVYAAIFQTLYHPEHEMICYFSASSQHTVVREGVKMLLVCSVDPFTTVQAMWPSYTKEECMRETKQRLTSVEYKEVPLS